MNTIRATPYTPAVAVARRRQGHGPCHASDARSARYHFGASSDIRATATPFTFSAEEATSAA